MPHAAVIIKLYLHMKLSQPFLQIQGIGEQDLILTHLDIGGRKSREIRKKRGDKGISQILSVRIVTDCLIDIFLGKDRVDLRFQFMGSSALCKVRPGREEDDAPWKNAALFL